MASPFNTEGDAGASQEGSQMSTDTLTLHSATYAEVAWDIPTGIGSDRFSFTVKQRAWSGERYAFDWRIAHVSDSPALVSPLASGDDLCGPATNTIPDALEMSHGLLSFLSAYAEALAYGRETSENRELFPVSCVDMAEQIGSDGFTLMAQELSCAVYVKRAAELGREHGVAAANWYPIDSEGAARRIIAGAADDIDPAVVDTFPSAPLSGEWADGMTEAQLLEEIGCDFEAGAVDGYLPEDETTQGEIADEIACAYSDAYSEAAADEIVRRARALLAS